MQLKSMSVDRLMSLREKVDDALKTRIADARSDLEARLKELTGFGGSQKSGRRGLRGRIPPKYRNPDNPNETWTGRGLPPRWLASKLKRGVRVEDFLIDGAPRKRRKAVKARKAVRKNPRLREASKTRSAPKQRKAQTRRKTAKPAEVQPHPTVVTAPPPIDQGATETLST